jgi:muramoyltetrapeptide carboxypeptidase
LGKSLAILRTITSLKIALEKVQLSRLSKALFAAMSVACHFPEPLQPGDLLYAIAPSGRLKELPAFVAGTDTWRQAGFRVEVDPHTYDRAGYLGGTDENRRQQLKRAWLHPECRGILCARGGYGTTRLLEDWQWPKIDRPKWLIGFSDITALLWSLSKEGIAGTHAPVLTTISLETAASRNRLLDILMGRPILPLTGDTWVGGTVSGRLLPANLTVATHLLHTPHQPNLDGVILALEDVTEAPYRIDRMLTQWRATGAFRGVKGIALGRFSQCEPTDSGSSFTVEEVLHDRLSDLGIPIVANLPFGHDGANYALPVGTIATLDGNAGVLSFDRN